MKGGVWGWGVVWGLIAAIGLLAILAGMEGWEGAPPVSRPATGRLLRQATIRFERPVSDNPRQVWVCYEQEGGR